WSVTGVQTCALPICFPECLHEKLRAILSLGMPRAAADLKLDVEGAILQPPCRDAVLIGNDLIGGRRLRKSQCRQQEHNCKRPENARSCRHAPPEEWLSL